MVILLLFFFSGVTALIYEVIWSDYLTLLFGSTIQAQTVVLAVFMGGLALGNRLFGRFADQIRRPLVIYGCLELAIGVYAFFFSFIYQLANDIFIPVGSKLLDHSGCLLFLNGLLSVLLLLGPTILMGGTLPILAAWLQKNSADAGRRAARFYSINTLGAVCGAWLAGFLLVEWLGLRRTMEAAAVVNLLVGFIAVSIGRKPVAQVSGMDKGSETPKPEAVPSQAASTIFRWNCVLVALTGAVSMGLEILASRYLCLIFGASLQSFAIVLMSFILGIGIGSAVIASPYCRHWPKEITTILLLLGASAMIGLLVFHIEKLATIYLYMKSGLSRTAVGYSLLEIFAALISIFVLGLPAAALGSVLPLWIRAAPETSDLLGDRVGRLVTWNTLAAVVGVLLTGFVLMPKIGLRDSFAVLGLLLAVAAVITALAMQRRVAAVAGAVVGALVLMAALSGDANWRYVFSIGIFRLPDMDFSQDKSPLHSHMESWRKVAQLLFYEDAADATVSVERVKVPQGTNDETVLRINGKPDASAGNDPANADTPAQILLAHLPLMLKPDSKDVFCFGMGSGITAGSVLGYPIERLTVAENCAPVLRAVRLFDRWNHGVATNSRVRIYREDARTVLKLSPQKYDVIISEPSNPWMVGIGRVFSRGFYQLAATRLKPGGIMTQWFHLYEMDDKTLNLVLRTFGSVFPNMEIWDVGDNDIILLGSDQPWESAPEAYRRAFELEEPRLELASLGLMTPPEVLTRQFASQQTAFALAGPGPVESDNLPLLEYEAPRAFYMYQNRQGVQQMQNYDERTWQMALAAPAKNKVIAELNLADLHRIFGTSFGSGNPQLQSYLNNRFQGQVGSMAFGNRIMPCVFKDTNAAIIVYAARSAATNAISSRLYYAELALRTNPQDWPKAVQSIGNMLDDLKNYNPQDMDWSPAYYADLAVKASLRLGNPAQAKAILLRGLQLEPGSDQLAYLSRILIREGILQPGEVPPLARSGGKPTLVN
jgi:predicted membrane-bound spermidine synthase